LLANIEVHERICSVRAMPTLREEPRTTASTHHAAPKPQDAAASAGRPLVATPAPKPGPPANRQRRPPPIVEVLKRGSVKTVACRYCNQQVPVARLGEHQSRCLGSP